MLSFPQAKLLKVDHFSHPTGLHSIHSPLGSIKCSGRPTFCSNIQVADWTYQILDMNPWFPGCLSFSPLTYSLGPDLLQFSNFYHILIDNLTLMRRSRGIYAHNLLCKGNRMELSTASTARLGQICTHDRHRTTT